MINVSYVSVIVVRNQNESSCYRTVSYMLPTTGEMIGNFRQFTDYLNTMFTIRKHNIRSYQLH